MFDPRDDARDRDGREDRRARMYDERDRDDDPREGLMRDLDLPRGEERELVAVRDHVYELDGEDSRTLAAVGAFRVVPEHDLDIDHDTLDHLRDEGLVETVDLGDDERGLTLTREGRDLLDSHSMERDGGASQTFFAGVSREREVEHDSNLYATYRQEEARLRDEHGGLEVKRVVLDHNLKRDNYLQPDDYPHIAFGTGRQRTVRCFPDKLPIGIDKDDHDRLVFLYLVNRRLPVDFRQFLIRHAKVFGFVTTWTVRLLVPRRFRKAIALYKAAVREELWTPMNPSVCTRLETYFAQCRAEGRHIADPDDRYIREEFRKQGMPKIQALYRAWRRGGDQVLWWGSSTTLRDARELGRSRLEVELLNRQYLQLTGTMDRDVWEKRGAKRKSRQVGPPISTLVPSPLSPLDSHEREPQASA